VSNLVGVATHQSNRAHNNDQNDGKHYGIFSDVLALLVAPERLKDLPHFPTS
jgi:hypothetical protein